MEKKSPSLGKARLLANRSLLSCSKGELSFAVLIFIAIQKRSKSFVKVLTIFFQGLGTYISSMSSISAEKRIKSWLILAMGIWKENLLATLILKLWKMRCFILRQFLEELDLWPLPHSFPIFSCFGSRSFNLFVWEASCFQLFEAQDKNSLEAQERLHFCG